MCVCIQIGTDDVCGSPLVKDLFEETGDFCRVSKRKCNKHISWEKLRRAEIDMERLRQVRFSPIPMDYTHHHHRHWAAIVPRGWGRASACRLQFSLFCAVLCHIVSLRYLSRSSLHRLAGLPCRLFLSYGIHMATCKVHPSSLRQLMCPAQDHFIFPTLLILSGFSNIHR